VVAISSDDREASQDFARRYGIWFPLVADEDLTIAKQWVGVNDEGYAIPGVFILERGGRVAFRKIDDNKYDRLYGPELLATIDRVLGTSEDQRVAARGGFETITSPQLRLGAGGGGTRATGDTDPVGEVSLDAYYLVTRFVLLGVSTSLLVGDESRLAAGADLKLRLPQWADLFETYVSIPVGLAIELGDPVGDDRFGLRVGARLGLQFAVWPTGAPFLDIGVLADRFRGVAGATSIVARLGFAWLP
jgi:hypothetical protein